MPVCPVPQMEISRNVRGSVAAATASGTDAPSDVELSPGLATSQLPAVVDTIKTKWTLNPYSALPSA
jgi:hypothetical protein